MITLTGLFPGITLWGTRASLTPAAATSSRVSANG